MSTIYRAEKQTDPDKLPGQIVNRPSVYFAGGPVGYAREDGLYLRDVIQRIAAEEGVEIVSATEPCRRGNGLAFCCHQTRIERCEGCPYATVNS